MSYQLYIDPFYAEAPTIEKGSSLDLYFAGEVGEEYVNWAWLCGDNPFRNSMQDACVSSAAFNDIYNHAKGRAGKNRRRLVSALRAGPRAVLDFVRDKQNLRGLWGVDSGSKGARKKVLGKAVLAMAMVDVRAAGLPCPNEV
jgi:hypothetical protein